MASKNFFLKNNIKLIDIFFKHLVTDTNNNNNKYNVEITKEKFINKIIFLNF